MNVELRHLQVFEVLAQELNFTRAAARLHVSQQTVSAQLSELEKRIGAPLLTRTTRSVALTDAGRALLRHVPAIQFAVGQAVAETRAAAHGSRAALVVGLHGVAGLSLTPRVLRAFAAAHPDVDLGSRNIGFADAGAGLISGETDVALSWLPAPEGVDAVALVEDERRAVLAADHPLAALEVVPAADLADEPFVWVDEMDARVRDYWTLAEYRGGRPVRVGARITGFEDSWAAVRAGLAVAASPSLVLGALPGADIVTRPVRGLTPAVLAVLRRSNDDRPLVTGFVELAVREAATWTP